MLSADYILVVLFNGICSLRLVFYVGNLNSYLEYMSDNNLDTGTHCINLLPLVLYPLVMKQITWYPEIVLPGEGGEPLAAWYVRNVNYAIKL